jgi:hypothetical protein
MKRKLLAAAVGGALALTPAVASAGAVGGALALTPGVASAATVYTCLHGGPHGTNVVRTTSRFQAFALMFASRYICSPLP